MKSAGKNWGNDVNTVHIHNFLIKNITSLNPFATSSLALWGGNLLTCLTHQKWVYPLQVSYYTSSNNKAWGTPELLNKNIWEFLIVLWRCAFFPNSVSTQNNAYVIWSRLCNQSLLASSMTTWLKLKSSEKREPQHASIRLGCKQACLVFSELVIDAGEPNP